jgi:hypothetical protein
MTHQMHGIIICSEHQLLHSFYIQILQRYLFIHLFIYFFIMQIIHMRKHANREKNMYIYIYKKN